MKKYSLFFIIFFCTRCLLGMEKQQLNIADTVPDSVVQLLQTNFNCRLSPNVPDSLVQLIKDCAQRGNVYPQNRIFLLMLDVHHTKIASSVVELNDESVNSYALLFPHDGDWGIPRISHGSRCGLILSSLRAIQQCCIHKMQANEEWALVSGLKDCFTCAAEFVGSRPPEGDALTLAKALSLLTNMDHGKRCPVHMGTTVRIKTPYGELRYPSD